MAINFHEDLRKAEVVRGSSDRTFGLVFAAFFTFWALSPLRHHRPFRPAGLVIAAIFLLIALLKPSLLTPFNRLWSKLGLLMGKVMNPVVMTILFFLVFTPIAFVLRLLGKDMLRLRYDRKASSYWIPRDPPGPAPGSMSVQF